MKHPTISVVIPAHNLEEMIVSTVESVLAQTDVPDEILVVDDGSTDRTVAVVERLRADRGATTLRIITADHGGAGAARNRGIAAAEGEWIAFLDGDDLWLPKKVERLRSEILRNPAATVIAHDNQELGSGGELKPLPLHQWFDERLPLLPQLYRSNFLATSCVAVRRDVLQAQGGFDESLPASQDFDLWLKLARNGRLVFIPEVLETYRPRPEGISSRGFERYRCVLRIAYRHAPYVKPMIGWREALLLRLRLVAIAHWYALRQRLSLSAMPKMAMVILRSPWEILRALVTPLTAVTGDSN